MNPVTPDPHTKCARCQCARDWHRNGPCSAKDEFGLCCHDRGCPGFVEPVLHIRSIVSNGADRIVDIFEIPRTAKGNIPPSIVELLSIHLRHGHTITLKEIVAS